MGEKTPPRWVFVLAILPLLVLPNSGTSSDRGEEEFLDVLDSELSRMNAERQEEEELSKLMEADYAENFDGLEDTSRKLSLRDDGVDGSERKAEYFDQFNELRSSRPSEERSHLRMRSPSHRRRSLFLSKRSPKRRRWLKRVGSKVGKVCLKNPSLCAGLLGK